MPCPHRRQVWANHVESRCTEFSIANAFSGMTVAVSEPSRGLQSGEWNDGSTTCMSQCRSLGSDDGRVSYALTLTHEPYNHQPNLLKSAYKNRLVKGLTDSFHPRRFSGV
eukprot:1490694-Pyramimonas_sp.AAC.1